MVNFFFKNYEKILRALIEHLFLVCISLIIGVFIAFIILILSKSYRKLGTVFLQFFSFVYAIPSLALLAIFIPFTGLGTNTTIIVLVLYMQFILLRSFITGVEEVDKNIIEAATGIGLTNLQILFRIQLPLSKLAIINGIRLALGSTISIATIAATINAGGLGDILLDGMRTMNINKILVGTIFIGVLVLSLNIILNFIEKKFQEKSEVT